MELGCTWPLQRAAKLKDLPYGAEELFFCWDIHILTLHQRQCLVGTNAYSRFAFVLFDLTCWEWKALEEAALCGMEKSLCAAGFSSEALGAYLKEAGRVRLTRTHGRRPVAFLNRMIDELFKNDALIDPSKQHQPFLESVLNGAPCRAAGEEGMESAAARMKRAFDVRYASAKKEEVL